MSRWIESFLSVLIWRKNVTYTAFYTPQMSSEKWEELVTARPVIRDGVELDDEGEGAAVLVEKDAELSVTFRARKQRLDLDDPRYRGSLTKRKDLEGNDAVQEEDSDTDDAGNSEHLEDEEQSLSDSDAEPVHDVVEDMEAESGEESQQPTLSQAQMQSIREEIEKGKAVKTQASLAELRRRKC